MLIIYNNNYIVKTDRLTAMHDVVVLGAEADRVPEVAAGDGRVEGLRFNTRTFQQKSLSDGALEEQARAAGVVDEVVEAFQAQRLELGVVELRSVAVVGLERVLGRDGREAGRKRDSHVAETCIFNWSVLNVGRITITYM